VKLEDGLARSARMTIVDEQHAIADETSPPMVAPAAN
jgi:hypothetical protein